MSEEVKCDAKLLYKNVDPGNGKTTALCLHMFKPEGWVEDDERPALVFFFGGGWQVGTAEHFYRQARHFANLGLVSFCVEYRTETSHGVKPHSCLSDAKSAMRWVRSHAMELGVDPQKILSGGGSAGGHLAAAVSVLKGFDEAGEDLSVSCRAQASILFNPVLDNGPEGYGHDRVNEYWEDFSVLHNIDENAPPMLLMLGTEDHLIPVSVGHDFIERMKQHGARHELVLYEGVGHGFFNNGEHFNQTLSASQSFITELGYIKS